MAFVLDAWAVLALLDGTEPAAGRVEAILDAERPVMSWINLGEVAYVLIRRNGERAALSTLADLRPRVAAEAASEGRILEAARIKAAHPLSYADAFAAATALAHGAVLATGDPELLREDAPWDWEDLR